MSDASDLRDLLQGHYSSAESKRLIAWGKVAASLALVAILVTRIMPFIERQSRLVPILRKAPIL